MNLMNEAEKMAVSNGRACEEDIELLGQVMEGLGEKPTVVKIGANAAMSVAVLATKPEATLWMIDDNNEPLNWEIAALTNLGLINERHRRMVGPSDRIAETYSGPKIDLLVLDLSCTYDGVMADLRSWSKHLKEKSFVFVHDYDGSMAPASYPEIAKAANDFFKVKPLYVRGWSAVFQVGGVKKQPKVIKRK